MLYAKAMNEGIRVINHFKLVSKFIELITKKILKFFGKRFVWFSFEDVSCQLINIKLLFNFELGGPPRGIPFELEVVLIMTSTSC